MHPPPRLWLLCHFGRGIFLRRRRPAELARLGRAARAPARLLRVEELGGAIFSLLSSSISLF